MVEIEAVWSGHFYLELCDFGSCLAWPRVVIACPARSAKPIRGAGWREGGGPDMGGIAR